MNIMKTITNLMAFLATLILFNSCITPDRYLADSRMRERNNIYQLEQHKREEAARLEIFRINANNALYASVNQLAIELNDKLGNSATPEYDFSTEHISYYYSEGKAVCPVTFYLYRRNKEVTIKGILTYYNNANRQVKFVCTDAVNTRKIDGEYIRALSEGIVYNTI